MFTEGINVRVYCGDVFLKVGQILLKVRHCSSCANHWILNYNFKQQRTYRCDLCGVLVWFRRNPQVCGFDERVRYSIIYLYRFLGLNGLMANVRHITHPDLLNVESYILGYKVTLITISVLNHSYIWSSLHTYRLLRSLQDFIIG